MSPPHDGPTCCFAGGNDALISDHRDGDGDDDGRCPHCHHHPSSSSSSTSTTTSSLNWYTYSNSDAINRIISASIKAFSIGAGLKGGVSIFSLLARLSRRRKVSDVSSSEEILSVIKETLRYGLFLGTFAGAFTSVDEIVAEHWGHRRISSLALTYGGVGKAEGFQYAGFEVIVGMVVIAGMEMIP